MTVLYSTTVTFFSFFDDPIATRPKIFYLRFHNKCSAHKKKNRSVKNLRDKNGHEIMNENILIIDNVKNKLRALKYLMKMFIAHSRKSSAIHKKNVWKNLLH